MRIFITGMGIISSLGQGIAKTKDSLINNKTGIEKLKIFPVANDPLPAGQIKETLSDEHPRTHILALIATQEALRNSNVTPDAVVMGVTTGGMPSSELLIKKNNFNPVMYKDHPTGSVAELIAEQTNCTGSVITISTACSSGTVALKIALDLLRVGKAKNILVGGADALCLLTYYGFNSLQLIDPNGAHPLDINRGGMSVSEGAGIMLISSSEQIPENAIAEISGIGLSCDAYHPASPHPEGEGALAAMENALKEAYLKPSDIDYINLHGTGTKDNDLAEAKAINQLFQNDIPSISSTKGAFGHTIGAAGAIEAIVSAISVHDGFIPASKGCDEVDPELHVNPVLSPINREVKNVLSNSFGFGGNNASIIISKIKKENRSFTKKRLMQFEILGSACITGCGGIEESVKTLVNGNNCKGILSTSVLSENLEKRAIRRLKRLPRMTLSLADSAVKNSKTDSNPDSIYMGTAWGALSETYDFLKKLFETDEQFTSPTDFIGSVHNAPSGHVAIKYNSKKENITTTGGDYSFEQSLYSAALIAEDTKSSLLVIGADEYHEILSPIFDSSTAIDTIKSDGGGALHLKTTNKRNELRIAPIFFKSSKEKDILELVIHELGGAERINSDFKAIFAGIPKALRDTGKYQLNKFIDLIKFEDEVIDYRKFLGEYGTCSATATALAINFLQSDKIPNFLCNKDFLSFNEQGILMLSFGDYISATEIII